MPVRPLFRKAQQYQDDGSLGGSPGNEVIIVFSLEIVDDFAVLQLQIDGRFSLVVQRKARVNEAIPALGDRSELPVDSIVVPMRGIVDSGDPSQGVNVSKTKAFFGMLFCDRQGRGPRQSESCRPGVFKRLSNGFWAEQ